MANQSFDNATPLTTADQGGALPPDHPPLRSGLCTQAQLESPAFRWWAQRMDQPFRLHRKLWEFCYVAQAMFEHGMLRPGKRGLGFAVGQEPLPALFASFGCEIVATDLHPDKADPGWVRTNQHAATLEPLQRPAVCDPELFRRQVTFRFVDMNDIPEDLTGFDFVWSCCSLEHLGSLRQGKRFLRRMVRCLKPGGVAVHTTEFNVSSNGRTVETGGSVIFRRRDLEEVRTVLSRAGHEVIGVDYDTGSGPADRHVDQPPYPQEVHLKLNLFGYTSTSAGLITRIGQDNGSDWDAFEQGAAKPAWWYWRRWLAATPGRLAQPQPADRPKEVIFEVTDRDIMRVPDQVGSEGGFLCTTSVDLSAGKYECEVAPQWVAPGAKIVLAALVLESGNWRLLANQVIAVARRNQHQPPFRLSFTLDRQCTVSFHVHTNIAWAKTSLHHFRLSQAATPRQSLSLPVIAKKPYQSWPIDRLRFVILGTNSVCNASCVHCPTNKEWTRHLPKKNMSWELFEKLIREIRDLRLTVDGHLAFGLYAEPLLDPLVVRRAELVKQYLPNTPLVITTNGGPLTDTLAAELGKFVDVFCVHIEALSPALYQDLMRPLRAEEVFPKVERLIRTGGKPVWIVCPTHRKNVHEVKALSRYWLERGAATVIPSPFANRCVHTPQAAELAFAPTPGGCRQEVTFDLVVDWDGAVLACCQDFLKRNQIGDLQKESLREVLANPARKEVFEKLAAGQREGFVTCKNCQFDSYQSMEQMLAAHD